MNLHPAFWLAGGALACAVALGACDPSVGPDASTLVPKPGLELTVESYDLNGSGARIGGSRDIDYISFSPDTSAHGGRTNVVRMLRREDFNSSSFETTYWHIEENGDIALYQPARTIGPLQINERWVSFPIGVKVNSVKTTVVDTTFLRTGNPTAYRYKEVWTSSFLGSDSLDTGAVRPTVKRGDLPLVKAQVVQAVTESQNLPASPVLTTTIWYSPTLATIVRMEQFIATTTLPVGGTGFSTISYVQP